ncbi:MAG: serine/threonine protein kinase [Opitutales bacterium]
MDKDESRELFDFARENLNEFTQDLYAQAHPREMSQPSDTEEIAPLYSRLNQIEDRYHSVESLGVGGMKQIYKAYDSQTERDVALACPKEEVSLDHYDAFLREAHFTARLEHPAIIDLFDMGVDKAGRPFFTMELKKGSSLHELTKQIESGEKHISIQQRMRVVQKICDAMTYAHANRIVHLDLKPENIQVGTFGEVQVCDWGMAVVFSTEEDSTLLDPDLYGPLLNLKAGTPGFMAPEQKDPREAKTPQMDIYALGRLIEETVGAGHESSMTDPALVAIVRKACEENPHERYATMEALGADIERFLDGYAVSTEQTHILRELKRFYLRNKTASQVALVFSILLIAGTSIFIMQLDQSRATAELALSQYLQEKQISEERLRNQASVAARQATALTRFNTLPDALARNVKEALKQVNAVLQYDPPPNLYVWTQKVWLCSIRQDFQAALRTERQRNQHPESESLNVQDLVDLAHKYAPKLQENGCLSAEDLLNYIQDIYTNPLYNRTQFLELLLIYDSAFERPAADRIFIVNGVLALLNPDASGPIMKQSSDGVWKIVDPGVAHLGFSNTWSVLAVVEPLKLSLQQSSVQQLLPLKSLNVRELDLRGLRIKTLNPLSEHKSLQKLIVAPGQFRPAQLAKLPDGVEVVEK